MSKAHKITADIQDKTGKAVITKEPVQDELPEAPATTDLAKTIDLGAEVAGAIFQAATNATGYFNTTGSEHATSVAPGIVRVELPCPDFGRKTVEVVVPETFTFIMREG
jgi:hypothetical protein